MTLRYYVLEGHKAVLVARYDEPDFMVWAQWYATADRQVAIDRLPLATVSTVFLGLDHGWFNDRPPLIFETMVFAHPALDGPLKDFQGRCSTWEQAEAMHAEVMKELLAAHQEAAG